MSIETKRIRAVFETDTSKYNSSLNGINKQMKMYQSEVKAASTDTKNFGKNAENLSKTAQGLAKQIELNKSKIKLYEDAMAKSNQKVQDGITKRKALEQQLKDNEKEYNNIVKAYGKESEQAKVLKATIDDLNNQYSKNEKQIESNIKKVADYNTNVNKAKTDISNLQGQLDKTNEALNQHTSRWTKASEKLNVFSENAKKVGSTVNSIGNGILKVSGVAATGIGAATKSFMDFEQQIAKVSTIADYTNISMEDLKGGIINLSIETGMATSDLNEALYQTLSAGVETADSVSFLGEAVKLAKGGFTSTTNAVDILTTVLNAYGLEASETTKVSDILVQTQNKGKTSVDQLASSLGKVIPTAKSANVNFEQLGAAVALMTSKGIATSESVTYLNSAINELAKSGTNASNELKKATGKTFRELMEDGKSLGDVMSSLNDYAIKNGKSLADMFGSAEAGKAALTLATDSGKEFNKVLNDMSDSAGATQEAYDTMMNTRSESLAVSLNKVKVSFMKLGEAAVPIVDELAELISKLGDFIGSLSDDQLKSIVNFTKWGLIAGGSSKIIGGTISTVGNLTSGLGKLTGKLATTSTATAGATSAITAATTGTSFLSKAISAGSLLFNPWTIGIGAAAAGGYALYKTLQKDVVPSVDLFADAMIKTGTVINEYGEVAVMQSIKISEATQENVQAYLNMEQGVTESLQSLYITSTSITQENADALVNQFSQMGDMITSELSQDKENDLAVLQQSFAANSALTEEEQAKIISQLNSHYEIKSNEINAGEERIKEILANASENNRELNKNELEEITQIKLNMRDTAVKCLSEQAEESQAILDRMASYDRRVTTDMAAVHVKELNEARDKAVEAANKEYRDTLAIAEKMKSDGTSESIELADKLIEEAERQKKGVIEKSNETREKGLNKLEESYADLRNEVNTDTGEILSYWDKLKQKFGNMGGKTTYTVETKYTTTGKPASGVNYNSSSINRSIRRVAIPQHNVDIVRGLTKQVSTKESSFQFDYTRVENMLDKFSKQISSIDRNTKVLISAKELAGASAGYTNEELDRLRVIESFGYSD